MIPKACVFTSAPRACPERNRRGSPQLRCCPGQNYGTTEYSSSGSWNPLNRDVSALKIPGNNATTPPNRNLVRFGSSSLLVHQNCDGATVRPRRGRKSRQRIQHFPRLQNLLFIRGNAAEQPNRLRTDDEIRIAPVSGLLRRRVFCRIGFSNAL